MGLIKGLLSNHIISLIQGICETNGVNGPGPVKQISFEGPIWPITRLYVPGVAHYLRGGKILEKSLPFRTLQGTRCLEVGLRRGPAPLCCS